MSDVNKVVLAYSGGLDTSVIVRWLQDTYNCEVVTFTADIGQGEEVEPARAKAQAMGIKEIYIDDLREEFVRDFVFPMFRAGAVYEDSYLLALDKRTGQEVWRTPRDEKSNWATPFVWAMHERAKDNAIQALPASDRATSCTRRHAARAPGLSRSP